MQYVICGAVVWFICAVAAYMMSRAYFRQWGWNVGRRRFVLSRSLFFGPIWLAFVLMEYGPNFGANKGKKARW